MILRSDTEENTIGFVNARASGHGGASFCAEH